jgi:two-component system response regulator AtoC
MYPSRNSRALSVLVGDDDGAIRECVTEVLIALEFEVHVAPCGTSALRILLQESIDFSILDVEMPDMTGLQVIERYASGPWIAGADSPPERPAPRRMPTIFMSGNPAHEIRSACESLGSSFLDKPFAAQDMRSAVNRILDELSL